MPTTEESFLLGHDATIETDEKDNAAVHSSTRPRLLLATAFLVVMAVFGVLSCRSLQSTSTQKMLVQSGTTSLPRNYPFWAYKVPEEVQQLPSVPDWPLLAYTFARNPKRKLGMCEGDCDGDGDCEDGLICIEREPGDPLPRGCYGDDFQDSDHSSNPYDYCAPVVKVSFLGGAPSQKLGLCEGDCDTDEDCKGALVCLERGDDGKPPPGCKGAVNIDYDYCVYPPSSFKPMRNVMKNVAPGDKKQPLGRCEGHCDSDSDCDNGLKCQERVDGGQAVPSGCFGSDWVDSWNYCVPTNALIHWGSYPTEHFPLGHCEGDCDAGECGSGLTCFQRDWYDYDIPGCMGRPVGEYDYCVFESDIN